MSKNRDLRAIMMTQDDNVAVAVVDLEAGSRVNALRGGEMIQTVIKNSIPFGHKYAIKKIQEGEPIVKYGETIGASTGSIDEGEHVHVHNMASLRGRGDKACKVALTP